ncbi:hypothetical protein [Sphingomonas agri]|uniref:hypothetical protein n=1 Tax=Sphingomonas agri TaxID=1813878 RepID=UPI00311FE4F3
MTINVLLRSDDSNGFDKRLKLAPMMLLASACFLSACGSAGATDAASAMKSSKANVNSNGGGPTTPTPTPTTTSTSTSSTTVTYDTSVGNGVDANGFASLPLRSGAHRYFVSSAKGSDANSCAAAQVSNTPKATIASALSCVANGNGDQVLVSEGTTYSEPMSGLNGKSGFSALYPTVIQTYDPADPLNDTKYGRGDQRGARPVMKGDGEPIGGGSGAVSYVAIRGFDFNPGNVNDRAVSLLPNGTANAAFVLIENNLFRYTTFSADMISASSQSDHLILRNNSIYGTWSVNDKAGQGIYFDGWQNATIEDNVIYHAGWKIGASRDDGVANGGPSMFKHSIYEQSTNAGPCITRRNLIADGSADGGQYRSNSTVSENVYIDNPISVSAGGGSNYYLYQPTGVNLEVSYNAILGDADLNSSNPRGVAIEASNGRLGSSVHHNLIARSRNVNGVNNWAFVTAADFNQPSYMGWDHNVVYQWTTALQIYLPGGAYPSQDFPTYTNNIWDAASSGTNTNIAGGTYPNPYTATQLYAALGFPDKQTFINYAIEHPEAHIQRQARTLLFAGYGM